MQVAQAFVSAALARLRRDRTAIGASARAAAMLVTMTIPAFFHTFVS